MATSLFAPTREYVDADFTFASHPETHNIVIKKNSNAVKQSILHLMRLREGDKPFHPEIQSPIYKYLFENISVGTKIVLESEVMKYINYYEPRVSLTGVTVTFPDPNTIHCVIKGIIINIQETFTVNVLVNRIR